MAKRKHSEEEIIEAHKLYQELNNLTKVSELTGIKRRTLSENFDKLGLKYSKRKQTIQFSLSDEQITEAYELYKKGASSIKLSEIFKVNINTILRAFERSNLPIRNNKENSRKYFVNNDYFEDIDTPEKAYWLGFIYADGYISIRKEGQKTFGIAISTIDEELLIKFNKCLDSTYTIKRYKTKEKNGYKSVEYSRVLITSDKLVDSLIKVGVVENKTNILKPPNLKYDLIRHFVRGYLDGDGTIGRSLKDYYVGFLGTDELLLFISNYLLDNNLINRINKFEKRKSGQIVSSVRYGGNIQAQRILDHLYEDASLYLARKYKVYKDLVEYNCRSHKQLCDDNPVNLQM